MRERLVAMTVLWLLGACNIDVPDLAKDGGGVGNGCSAFADLLVSYTPANETGSSADGEKALGAPDSDPVTVEENAVLEVGFVGLGGVIDGNGDDLAIKGTADASTLATAYVGKEQNDLRYAGDLSEGSLTLDLGTAETRVAVYVRIVGMKGALAVDAIEAVQTDCTNPDGG